MRGFDLGGRISSSMLAACGSAVSAGSGDDAGTSSSEIGRGSLPSRCGGATGLGTGDRDGSGVRYSGGGRGGGGGDISEKADAGGKEPVSVAVASERHGAPGWLRLESFSLASCLQSTAAASASASKPCKTQKQKCYNAEQNLHFL